MHKHATGRMLAQEISKIEKATAFVYIMLETFVCLNHIAAMGMMDKDRSGGMRKVRIVHNLSRPREGSVKYYSECRCSCKWSWRKYTAAKLMLKCLKHSLKAKNS